MFIASAIVSSLLTLLVAYSGVMKLQKNQSVMETLDAVGFLQDSAWILAVLELSGAVGLFVGLLWQPLAIAAGIGIVLYFVGAVAPTCAHTTPTSLRLS